MKSTPRHLGVSEHKGGTLFWGPYNKDPTIWGTIYLGYYIGPYNKDPTIWSTILGSPIFGNPLWIFRTIRPFSSSCVERGAVH